MIEKVNPSHPDKLADRIAGAIVDLAYKKEENPKVAVEVLIGHGVCHVIVESSVYVNQLDVLSAVTRITGDENIKLDYVSVPQDEHLSKNQEEEIRCGDNGIFKGVPLTYNEKKISAIARDIYDRWPYDGKYILTDEKLIICQSNAKSEDILKETIGLATQIRINPLGEWTGGPDVDTGATNRKLGSDMAQSVTGGGLHGKDLSKADVSVNIYAFQKAQETGKTITASCAIGDEYIDFEAEGEDEIERVPYKDVVEKARKYIKEQGGFEKFAEWGLY
jgi:S-adenosylmethionine synthetase